MKPGRVFWGTFFAAVGVFLLLERIGVMPIDWLSLWRYWPLVLVLWGVGILLAGRQWQWIVAALAGLFVGLVVAGFLSFTWLDDRDEWSPQAETKEFVVSVPTPVEKATFRLESGAGSFTIGDTTSELMTARTRSSVGEYTVTQDSLPGEQHLTMTLTGKKRGWHLRRMENTATIHLNQKPAWTLDVDAGAAKVDFDLVPFRVEELRLNTGASSVRLTLGDRADETRVTIDAGASSIRIRVPESSGCQLRVDAPLSSKSFGGFDRIQDGLYETGNYGTAAKKVLISVDAGVSSLKVTRY